MQTPNRRNVYILALSLVVVMLGFGLVVPIMPFYIERLGAGGTELGLLVASYAVMRLVFGPLWGSLSDRIGRKPVLMVGILGYAITMVWFGLATSLWMLFVARSLSGILSSATSPTTMAYISDSTTEAERSRGMGILGAAAGVGTVVGPGLGGWLAGNTLSLPFFIAAGMAVVSLLLVALFLPESLPAQGRRPAKRGEFSPVKALGQAIGSRIGGLLLMAFLVSLALTGFSGIFGLYALARFAYGPQQVGLALMVVGLVQAVAQGALTGPVTERWGEARVIKASLLVTAVGFAAIALAGSTVALLLATGLFSLATGLLSPAVSALTSRQTTMAQGITMGLSNAAMSLGRIAGPLSAGLGFDLDPGYPYLGGAVIMGAGFFAALRCVSQGTPEAQHSSDGRMRGDASGERQT